MATHTRFKKPFNHRTSKCLAVLVGVVVSVQLFAPCANAQPSGYPTIADIGNRLLTAETTYPSRCKRYNLGTSVQGRDMWAIRISGNVDVEEDEPEVRWISTMHGDEPVGLVMCLDLVDYLNINYGSDSRVTNIVDSMDIWIVPLMNPDGYIALQRYNHNGVDLNRNFPDIYTSPSNTTTGRAKETANIMNWTFGRHFTLAANLHGGALVVNYPYDGNPAGASVYSACPDDDMYIYISEQYSSHNLPMWNSSTFFHGITNGAEWYAINGGMQDWHYIYQHGNEVTIELGTTKTPPFSQMPNYWNDNRGAMLSYMETALVGVRGIVTDVDSGTPLAATVQVSGRSHSVNTDPSVGDYHRMLLPGTYELTISSAGHDTVTAQNVAVNSGSATRVDLAVGAPTVVSAPNGGESLQTGIATGVGFSGNMQLQHRVQFTSNYGDTTLTSDGFESGSIGGGYTQGGNSPWVAVSGGAHTGGFSAKSGAIGNNQRTWITRSFSGGALTFWYRVSSESGFDFFDFSVDGVRQVHASGTVGWTQFNGNVALGLTHELKWEYNKDGSTVSGSDAAWIDDLQLTTDATNWTDVATAPAGVSSVNFAPDRTGTECKVRARAEYSPTMFGAWDESDAVFTVEEGPPIPAASSWGLMIFSLSLLAIGTIIARRARTSGAFKIVVLGALLCAFTPGVLHAQAPNAFNDAVAAGNTKYVEDLLNNDPDLINKPGADGATPLHVAVRSLKPEMTKLLLDHGANPNLADQDGFTPLHLIAYVGRQDQGPLRSQIAAGLIEKHASLRAAEAQGKTPLHIAAMKGRTELLDPLRSAGAEVSARDKVGRTPLHDAAMYNHPEVVKWLLDHGASVSTTDDNGNTPLHVAALRLRPAIAEQLLAAGADVNARNRNDATPILLLISSENDEHEVETLATSVAEVLIRGHADVNLPDKSGKTPLAAAQGKSWSQLTALLQKSGAH